MANFFPKISIVVLTFNRKDYLIEQMKSLSSLKYDNIEIIVVDNASIESVADIVSTDLRAVLLRNEVNEGAVGRNRGMKFATGSIVITLDDDVFGLKDEHIDVIVRILDDESVAAVNFKILEDFTGRIVDWCHPCDPSVCSELSFDTNDISEGAVAFRRSSLEEVGVYPDYFFISHEGPDLAFRIINSGKRVVYSPNIIVTHAYAKAGRESWRRYYFDTRNQLWFVLRNLSFWYGFKRLAIGWGGMLFYSLRDGFFRYWIKAVWDSLLGAPRAWRDRVPPTVEARSQWQRIEECKPGFWTMVRKRLWARDVRI